MGGPVFDRQVFVKKKETPKPRMQSPLPGGLVLILVAALAAFATYRFVKAGGKSPSNPADKAQIAELQGKLKAMQAHVDELEKSHRSAPARHAHQETEAPKAQADAAEHSVPAAKIPASATPMAVDSNHSSTEADAPHSAASKSLPGVAGTDKTPLPATTQAASKPQPPPPDKQQASSKQLAALQGNIKASHEEWEATTNRLGNVVGELDTQRNALQKTQSGVNYLLQRVQSSDVSFTLTKGSGLKRVGPISMELASTSVKGQHYNIRMIVDDKSVVLKNRALNEVIQFYTSRSQYPLRLIVSQIERNQVSGTLAVPTALSQESASHKLQER